MQQENFLPVKSKIISIIYMIYRHIGLQSYTAVCSPSREVWKIICTDPPYFSRTQPYLKWTRSYLRQTQC